MIGHPPSICRLLSMPTHTVDGMHEELAVVVCMYVCLPIRRLDENEKHLWHAVSRPSSLPDRYPAPSYAISASSGRVGLPLSPPPYIHTPPASEQRTVSRRAYPDLLFHRGRCYGDGPAASTAATPYTPYIHPLLLLTLT
jgi:hypothetical protein